MVTFKQFLTEAIDVHHAMDEVEQIMLDTFKDAFQSMLYFVHDEFKKHLPNHEERWQAMDEYLEKEWKETRNNTNFWQAVFTHDLEKKLEKWIKQDLEKRYGKIESAAGKMFDLDDPKAPNLWFVADPLVQFDFKDDHKEKVSGHFDWSRPLSFTRRKRLMRYNPQEAQTIIQLNVDLNYISDGAYQFILDHLTDYQEEIRSLYREDWIKDFITELAKVFIHEYVHLLQYIQRNNKKNAWGNQKQFTRSLVKHKDPKDNRSIDPNDIKNNKEEWWQYYAGKPAEIEAFAAGAASKIINKIKRYESFRNGDVMNSTKDIKNSLHSEMIDLQGGYFSDSHAQNLYMARIKSHTENRKDFEIVWRRFCKKVYQHLMSYYNNLEDDPTYEDF